MLSISDAITGRQSIRSFARDKPVARQTIEVAQRHGAVGWKINGAGGNGGSMTILCPSDWAQRKRLTRAIEEIGGGVREIPIYLSRFGLRVWETRPGGPV